MTDIKQSLAEWKRLREAATKGEWQEGQAGSSNIIQFDGEDVHGVARAEGANKAFIIHAANSPLPSLYEKLVEECERLQGLVRDACNLATEMKRWTECEQWQYTDWCNVINRIRESIATPTPEEK